MSEAAATASPTLGEVLDWTGSELDDADGRRVGRVVGAYADAQDGGPVWLVVAVGRRRRAKAIVVPLRECAAMPGRVWTAQGSGAMQAAPAVDPTRPLLGEHEAAICAHYGVGERVGRHAEVVGRPADAITAHPAG